MIRFLFIASCFVVAALVTSFKRCLVRRLGRKLGVLPMLLLCYSVNAQYFGSFNTIPIMGNSFTPSVGPSVLGKLEYWVFTDLVTNNMPITNWIGEISGTIATNGAPSLQPTNSANGVMYGQDSGRQFLTNAPLDLGSNWTVIVRAKMTREGYSSSGLYPLWGEFGNNFSVGWNDGVDPKALFAWYSHAAINRSVGLQLNAIKGTYIDHCIVCSNNANGAGAIFGYTNAVLVGINNNQEANHTKFSCMSWNSSYLTSDVFDGLVENILICTQALAPSDILKIYQFNTNLFGP